MKRKKLLCSIVLGMLFLFVMVRPVNAAEKKIGTLTIYSHGSGLLEDQGHAFLAFRNNSSSKINIAGYKLPKGETITFGLWPSWPMTGSGPFYGVGGAYFNIEAVNKGSQPNCRFLSMKITKKQLNQIVSYFKENSYYRYAEDTVEGLLDAVAHNCTTAAIEAWNLVATDEDKLVGTGIDAPVNLKNQLEMKGCRTTVNFYCNTSADSTDICYLSKTTGKLVPVEIKKPEITKIKVIDSESIKVSWSSVLSKKYNNITGYEISCSGRNTFLETEYHTKIVTDKKAVSYTLKGLSPHTTYTIQVRAIYKDGTYDIKSSFSSAKKATTKAKITLNKKSITLYDDETVQLKANVIGKNPKVTWKSSKSSVASVNGSGKITGKKKGTVTITATANDVSAKCKVKVKERPASIKLDKTNVTLVIGNKIKLNATVTGKSKKVTWKSSKKSVAVVNSKGVITAKKKGTAIITATANGKKRTCRVKVTNRTWRSEYKKELEEGIYAYKKYWDYDYFYLLDLGYKYPQMILMYTSYENHYAMYSFCDEEEHNVYEPLNSIYSSDMQQQIYGGSIVYNKKYKCIVDRNDTSCRLYKDISDITGQTIPTQRIWKSTYTQIFGGYYIAEYKEKNGKYDTYASEVTEAEYQAFFDKYCNPEDLVEYTAIANTKANREKYFGTK